MKDKEIIEGNKLISEFMGKTVYPISGTPEFKKWKGEKCDYSHSELGYNHSWDWLMPVIEEIEKEIKKVRKDFNVSITDKTCIISVPYSESVIIHGSYKIEATWKAVVEFIKQRNQHKNK